MNNKQIKIATIVVFALLTTGALITYWATSSSFARQAADRTDSLPDGRGSVDQSAIKVTTGPLIAQQNAVSGVKYLHQYCSKCHAGGKQEGDFKLAILGATPNEITSPAWEDVLELVQNAEMPPEDEKQPTAAERTELTGWLSGLINAHKETFRERQEVRQMRRLTPTQYWNTLNALMGEEHVVKTPVPDFDVGKARDNYRLTMTPEHLDSFMQIAEEAMTQRLQPLRRPKVGHLSYSPHSKKYGLLSQKTFNNSFVSLDDAVGLLNNGNTNWGVHSVPFEIATWPIKVPGRYRIRVTARAHSEKSKAPVTMGIAARYHNKMLHAKGVAGSRTIKEVDLSIGNRFVVTECEVQASLGETIVVQKRSGKHDGGQKKGVKASTIREHLLLIKNIEIEGPIVNTWPTPAMAHLFGKFPSPPTEQDSVAMLLHFAEKAFRRPVAASQADQISRFFKTRLKRKPRSFSTTIWSPPTKGDHRYKNRFNGAVSKNRAFALDTDWRIESAIMETCVSILMNQQFLFQSEPDESDDYVIASRLAYFLWNGPPDENLLSMAKQGLLSRDSDRGKAVAYCLEHRSAGNFYQGFVDDWLSTDQVGVMEPDKRLYGKRYDGELRRAMRNQSEAVFREIVRTRQPASALLKSDWTMVNQRLAQHYGIEGVTGGKFQRVLLTRATAIRGSILGHAGIMSVLSNGTQTLPITRGVWVLDNILGTPSPPPPPNVPLIEPDTRGATTLREQVLKHREIGSCKRCHQKIDPLGIALENFDAIGGWRNHYADADGKKVKKGVRVDSSGVLADGKRIKGPDGLAEYLLEHRDAFDRCLTTKLFEYALGRPLGPDDAAAVNDVLKKAKAQDNSLHAIILLVATHSLFLE
jgi:hypothetical protein